MNTPQKMPLSNLQRQFQNPKSAPKTFFYQIKVQEFLEIKKRNLSKVSSKVAVRL